MKPSLLLIPIFLLACSSHHQDLVVNLNSQDGYGVFRPERTIVWPSDESIEYKNVPDGIDEYVVRGLPLQYGQFLWNQHLNKKISNKRFKDMVNYYKIDTSRLCNSDVDCEVLFLTGTRSGKRIIIVDSDNDEDFSNEKILEYDYPLSEDKQKEIDNNLPVVTAQYEYFENSRIETRKAKIMPSPYKGRLGLSFNTNNEIEKKYFLFASLPEYKKGSFSIDRLNYEVFVSNYFSRVYYPVWSVKVFIKLSTDSLPSELKGDIPYKIGDVFNSKGNDYSIDSVSYWGDKLFIRYLGKNTKPFGYTEGFYVLPFAAKRLDNSEFKLNQYPGKYILLDFWGTWCKPCINFIPELKKIYADYPHDKFALVSIAYDSDPKAVEEFTKKENMDWEHVFVSQNLQDKNSIIEKLKISSYPTTILIDPEGKIIARNPDIEKLRKILNEKIIGSK